jgi:hypothetical protein
MLVKNLLQEQLLELLLPGGKPKAVLGLPMALLQVLPV